MDFGISSRVALVCGGSRGIGYATAEILAREGVSVMICSRDEASVNSAVQKLRVFNPSAAGIAADVSKMDGVKHLVNGTLEKFGKVDILITNTGGPAPGAALSNSWSEWEAATCLLLRSAVELTRAFVPGMRERKWGRVIGITSMAVKHPMPHMVLSNSLRAAVTSYFRTLGDEVARDGVTMNTVLPGYTNTDRLEYLVESAATHTGLSTESVYDGYKAHVPAARLGKPEECGAVIAFLASEQAAYVTCQAISVDGGFGHALL